EQEQLLRDRRFTGIGVRNNRKGAPTHGFGSKIKGSHKNPSARGEKKTGILAALCFNTRLLPELAMCATTDRAAKIVGFLFEQVEIFWKQTGLMN
ncbi:MAG: hypothetical protein IE913_09500, partial [Halothiobacillus sp.]|nr:hypothetical protein [Halothiobacillus sp.]